jgi:hypothetical protein
VTGQERRRYGRIDLEEPLPAYVGEVPVRVADLSVVGFRVLHELRFPPGDPKLIRMRWDGRDMRFMCTVIRSTMVHMAGKNVYQTGMRIDSAIEDSEEQLREFIAARVIRALEEQKANARGMPPLSKGYTYQVGKTNHLRRYELVDGRWRKVETVDPTQPPGGFTIAADIDPMQVDMLCKTWERTDAEGRRLTQLLAQLSIKKTEGTPTRRYVP